MGSGDVSKIVETYDNRTDAEKYAHEASLDEIKDNDYNLNTPRYIDAFEQKEEIDLAEVKKLLDQDNQEIAELETLIA